VLSPYFPRETQQLPPRFEPQGNEVLGFSHHPSGTRRAVGGFAQKRERRRHRVEIARVYFDDTVAGTFVFVTGSSVSDGTGERIFRTVPTRVGVHLILSASCVIIIIIIFLFVVLVVVNEPHDVFHRNRPAHDAVRFHEAVRDCRFEQPACQRWGRVAVKLALVVGNSGWVW
jgi:hypothetical protein